jgi:hypothetical protein
VQDLEIQAKVSRESGDFYKIQAGVVASLASGKDVVVVGFTS